MVDAIATTIYLVRHGEIEANASRCWHGWTDSKLNERGQAQAARMGSYLAARDPAISFVYSSPLERARHTASSLAKALRLEALAHEDLKEWGIGTLEGQPYQALNDDHGFFEKIADLDYAPPEGESVNQVCGRMMRALDQIRTRHNGHTLALVGHGAAMAIALAKLLDGAPVPFYQYHMDNTAITKLVWREGPVMEYFNATDHLSEGE